MLVRSYDEWCLGASLPYDSYFDFQSACGREGKNFDRKTAYGQDRTKLRNESVRKGVMQSEEFKDECFPLPFLSIPRPFEQFI